MPDEVLTTRRPDAPLSRAHAVGPAVHLVVATATASPEAVQRISVLSGLPVIAVRRLHAAGQPVIVGRAPHEGHAEALRRDLQDAHGLQLDVLSPDDTARTGAILLSAAVALVALGAAATALLVFGSAVTALLSLAIGAGAAWLAVRLRAGVGAARRHSAALDGHDREARALDQRQGAWSALLALRATTLDDRWPPAAQADAWAGLDALEADLARGADPARIAASLAALSAEANAPAQGAGGPGDTSLASDDALIQVRRALAAARQAHAETAALGGRTRGS